MTLIAVWIALEANDPARLWMASDSRLGDDGGRIIDEGVKLYEVPVICRGPSPETGLFTTVYFANTIGLGCAGSSLIYHQVQANLMPLLSNLIGQVGAVPSLENIANFVAAIATRYVQSLGIRNPEGARQLQLVLAGWCPVTESLLAFGMRPVLQEDSVCFDVSAVDLTLPYFAGDRVGRARGLLEQIVADNVPGAPSSRAALNVLRQMIDDPETPTIGGDVQVGFTVGPAFRRVQTSRPIPGQEPRAAFWLNSICTDDLPRVGPCALGLMGSISP